MPDLETEATGDLGELVPALLKSADQLDIEPRIVPPEEWSYGEAKGVCKQRYPMTMRLKVEVKDRENRADLAGTLIHEYAHALLHFDAKDKTERSKREVEAEAVAYVVGRYFGLDMSGSVFYLAAWSSDDSEAVSDRLGRISNTAHELIETLEQKPKVAAGSKAGEAA